MRSLVMLVTSGAALASGNNIANIIFLNTSDGAVCLDGSPAAYYLRVEAETRKFYIHTQGGGWCETDADCVLRASTRLGSSNFYNSSTDLGGGYLSNDPAINPMMWNWTKVFAPYCDGSSQTSDLTAAVVVGTDTIFYRGHRILVALQQALFQYTQLAEATDVVIAGDSAGGLTAYLHVDEWAALLPSTTKVVALPDSGFFLDYNSTYAPNRTIGHAFKSSTYRKPYGAALRWVFNRMNGTDGVPQACRDGNSEDPAKCIFAEHVSKTLKSPTFGLQSEYDSWQVQNDLWVTAANATLINPYGALLTSRVESDLLGTGREHGVFLDSCYHHTGFWGDISIDGQVQAQAFAQWYAEIGKAGAKKEWKQGQLYPCPACCKL